MKFIVDAQLPPALARCLVRLGHESEHVLNVGLLGADDRSIQQYAAEHNIVVITKDEDFAANLLWQKNNPAVIWCALAIAQIKHCSIGFYRYFPKYYCDYRKGKS